MTTTADTSDAALRTATTLHQAGRFQEALDHYHQALQADPRRADIYQYMAAIFNRQNQPEKAVACLQQAVTLNPTKFESVYNLAHILRRLNRIDEAISHYKQAIALNPGFAASHYNLANIYLGQARYDSACDCYHQAIGHQPHYPNAHNNLGMAFKQRGHTNQAIRCFEKAIEQNPRYADAYNNLAIELKDRGQTQDAIALLHKAVTLNPDHALAFNTLANAYKDLEQWDQAIDAYHKAITIDPDFTDAYANLATILCLTHQHESALEAYHRALTLDPDNSGAHYNRSLLLLLLGDYQQGWPEYQWRKKNSVGRHCRDDHLMSPRWDGASFVGQRLLVYCEQGLGDTIQMLRYLPLVKDLGGTLLLQAPQTILTLFHDTPWIDEYLDQDLSDPIHDDQHISIMDLPLVFNTTLETIPSITPYVTARPDKLAYWRQQLNSDRLKVGIVWAGNPQHKNDKNRSCPPRCFETLRGLNHIQWVSLQKGRARKEHEILARCLDITDLSDRLEDLSDCAAVIANLDLVISVDTAVAHLAGAMGKAVWILIPDTPDWRWMRQRPDSPWYASVTLFRQAQTGDWQTVFDRLRQRLNDSV